MIAVSKPIPTSAQTGSVNQASTTHNEHDPLEGMCDDGRIPKVKLPDYIRNPERWRYIPEGRLIEGNFVERFLVSSYALPVIFFEGDVGFGGGVSITDIDFRSQRRREFTGIFLSYTTEEQQRYALTWKRFLYHQDLEEGGVVQEERSYVRTKVGYSKTLTRRFFGLGADTRESDETSYTDEVGGANLSLNLSLPHPGDNVVFDVGIAFDHHNLSEGKVNDVPSTDEEFPGLVMSGDKHDLGWIRVGLRYDTRDSQASPYRGWTVGATLDAAPLQSQNDTGARYGAFAKVNIPVSAIFHGGAVGHEENPPTDVIAASAFLTDTTGDLPFYELPTLGGNNTLRGFIAGRWTDRSAWHAAVEHRLWIVPRGIRFTDAIRIERVGAAPFIDVGSVAKDVSSLSSAEVHASLGVGLRLMLERQAVFRSDFGFSDEGFNYVLKFGMPF